MLDAAPSKGAGEPVGYPVGAGEEPLLGGAGDPVPMGTTGTKVDSGEVGVSPAGELVGAAPQTVTVTVSGPDGGGAVVSPEAGPVG